MLVEREEVDMGGRVCNKIGVRFIFFFFFVVFFYLFLLFFFFFSYEAHQFQAQKCENKEGLFFFSFTK